MNLDLQSLLFDENPPRRILTAYTPMCDKQYTVQVFRNHSFEMVEHTIGAYLDYAGIGVSFTYSGYDDSFSFNELDSVADLTLIWIDLTRYTSDAASYVLNDCVERLQEYTTKPVLVIPFGMDVVLRKTNIIIFSLGDIAKELGQRFTDLRVKDLSGTPLSSEAMMRISRELGLKYFPALLRPSLKAVIVDLDNTLYSGVLGEDGIEGIVLTDGHLALQRELKKISNNGLFLCVATKNDEDQVLRLFEERKDFALRKEDFTTICASWESKADSIEKIIHFLNINPDSILFIDDNIGELAAIHMTYSQIKLIHAYEDGERTRRVVAEFPGLFRFSQSTEDALRKFDVQANELRQQMKQTMDTSEYLRSLELSLKYSHDKMDQAARVSELANKTNQFIFSYKRYSETDVERMMESPDYVVVTVSMTDKLSDSGLIGVCVGNRKDEHTEIEECFISCRALGRGIDHVIVLEAIRQISELFRQPIHVAFLQGERNKPAQKFAQSYLKKYLMAPRAFDWKFDADMQDAVHIEIIKLEDIMQ